MEVMKPQDCCEFDGFHLLEVECDKGDETRVQNFNGFLIARRILNSFSILWGAEPFEEHPKPFWGISEA